MYSFRIGHSHKETCVKSQKSFRDKDMPSTSQQQQSQWPNNLYLFVSIFNKSTPIKVHTSISQSALELVAEVAD